MNMMTLLSRWKAAFWTGLAVVLPAAVSIGVILWLFGLVASFTDMLLLFLPAAWTHTDAGKGPLHPYWSLIALAVAVLLLCLIGGLARHYFGKRLIQLVDLFFMRVPLLNKIYSALKQIHEAFTSRKTATFKQVVLVEFPRAGLYSVGFLTGRPNDAVQAGTGRKLLSVFVPTPPLTSGSIVLAPEADVLKLDMSVADGIKFIMSLGAVSPTCPPSGTNPGLGTVGPHATGHPPSGGAVVPAASEAPTRPGGRDRPRFSGRPRPTWSPRPRKLGAEFAG